MGDIVKLEAYMFAFYCRKYVQRADSRQKEMGLQYTEVETHDLAKETARVMHNFLTGLSP